MDSVTAAPILTPPDVSADDGAAAIAAEENAAAADVVAEMAEHLTIGTDNANATTGPVDLGAEGDVYSCKDCRIHLGLAADIITKSFYCSNGKAYLFDKVVNVNVGAQEDRMTMSGMYTMSDIFCVGCGATLGWKYVAAHERSQRYKEGKYFLERYMLIGPNGSGKPLLC